MRCALNFASQKGFSVKQRQLRTDDDVRSLIKELSDKSGMDVKLVRDEQTGELHMECHRQVNRDFILYYIPIAPTWEMRKETGELARRFLKAFADRFRIGTMLDSPQYDYENSTFEDQMTEQEELSKKSKKEEDKPENWFGPGWIELHREYQEGGTPYDRLMEFQGTKPLKRAELERFKPRTEAERKLKEMFAKGFDLMDTDVDIWNQRDTMFMSDSELQDLQSSGWLDWEDQCFIHYESDAYMDIIIDNINGLMQSGCETENIVIGGTLKEEGPLEFAEETADILNLIDDLSGFIADESLKKKTKTARKAA